MKENKLCQKDEGLTKILHQWILVKWKGNNEHVKTFVEVDYALLKLSELCKRNRKKKKKTDFDKMTETKMWAFWCVVDDGEHS